MQYMSSQIERKSLFKRKNILLSRERQKPSSGSLQRKSAKEVTEKVTEAQAQIPEQECTVLVINSSQDMAKEITLQLTLKIPGCSIMYAPTIELARWILKRRRIDLVVSSAILPDGSISGLKGILQSMQSPPDVVVVGDLKVKSAEILGSTGYEFAAVKRFSPVKNEEKPRALPKQLPLLKKTIQNLGADIRNDLNNPLQEIVALVFVAQAGETSPATDKALEAIDHAAKNMAKVVSELENKILNAVTPQAG
jgi:DNA-binding NtrC family response regulator